MRRIRADAHGQGHGEDRPALLRRRQMGGKQIVSAQWIAESTREHSRVEELNLCPTDICGGSQMIMHLQPWETAGNINLCQPGEKACHRHRFSFQRKYRGQNGLHKRMCGTCLLIRTWNCRLGV